MATHEVINEETSNGSAYSEIYYLDEKNNVVDSNIATHCVIREFTADGNLICETWGFTENYNK